MADMEGMNEPRRMGGQIFADPKGTTMGIVGVDADKSNEGGSECQRRHKYIQPLMLPWMRLCSCMHRWCMLNAWFCVHDDAANMEANTPSRRRPTQQIPAGMLGNASGNPTLAGHRLGTVGEGVRTIALRTMEGWCFCV